MKAYHNIDKSGFHRGQYVGYSNGVWHITKSTSSYGNWCARYRDNNRVPLLFAMTLGAMSEKLAVQPLVKLKPNNTQSIDDYESRVQANLDLGMTRSDAQGVVDAEDRNL